MINYNSTPPPEIMHISLPSPRGPAPIPQISPPPYRRSRSKSQSRSRGSSRSKHCRNKSKEKLEQQDVVDVPSVTVDAPDSKMGKDKKRY
jgi:hypothetical protein